MYAYGKSLKVAVAAIWVGFAMLLASPAHALPGGDWASASSPLRLVYNGGWVSDAYGTWQGYREDQGRGSRVQDWSANRDPGAASQPSNTDGSYNRHNWYNNGSYCYVASFSTAGSSMSCTSGWHGDGNTNTAYTKSKSWQYYETWHNADPTSQSTRGEMHACIEKPLASDTCTDAYFLRGSHY